MQYSVTNPPPYSSHDKMLQWIGHDRSVLELGCASGYFSKLLLQQGCHIVGVEIDPAAAQLARQYCSDVVIGDLNTLERIDYPENSFDVVLLADVLEHLVDPVTALGRWARYAKDEGQVMVSVPNVANWWTRRELLCGRWDYADSGILDRTHLHFYTRKTARQLIRLAGLEIVKEDFSQGLSLMGFYYATIHRVLTRFGAAERVNDRLTRWRPEWWAMKFLYIARKGQDDPVMGHIIGETLA
jgi:SAM-dependent methyltransferase